MRGVNRDIFEYGRSAGTDEGHPYSIMTISFTLPIIIIIVCVIDIIERLSSRGCQK